MPAVKSKRDAIAAHTGQDLADLSYYRYHHGHTSIPVYAFGNAYYCCTKGKEKPATHREGMVWDWVEVKDDFVNQDGFKIWRSGTE